MLLVSGVFDEVDRSLRVVRSRHGGCGEVDVAQIDSIDAAKGIGSIAMIERLLKDAKGQRMLYVVDGDLYGGGCGDLKDTLSD